MAVYKFAFPQSAAGMSVVVRDDSGDGSVVYSGTLGAASGGKVTLTRTLDEGLYEARASDSSGLRYDAEGVLDTTTTDGVGAVFFGGAEFEAPFDNVWVYSNFVATNDGPRAPQRDDLATIDPEDDTKLDINQSGLYLITLNVPIQPQLITVEPGDGPYQLEASVQPSINGFAQPPAYDFNYRAHWTITESTGYLETNFMNFTFPQVMLEGDVFRLGVRGLTSGVGATPGGTLQLDPDITLVLTYLGAVDLEA